MSSQGLLRSPRIVPFFGLAIWLGCLLVFLATPTHLGLGKLYLALAVLVLVPLGMERVPLAEQGRTRLRLCLAGAGLLFALGLHMPQGEVAGLMVIPWLVLTGGIAIEGLLRAWKFRNEPMADYCLAAAQAFLVIGAFWALFDRLGVRPLEFDSVIVFLTAVHFHYAGFVLPLIAGLVLRQFSGSLAWGTGLGVLIGIPLVAIGITTTQLGLNPLIESVSAWALAGAGLILACLQTRLAFRQSTPPLVATAWLVAGVSLGFSMLLAMLYGARFLFDLPWLDIDWMRALHGSANVLGFALVGLLGWTAFQERPQPA